MAASASGKPKVRRSQPERTTQARQRMVAEAIRIVARKGLAGLALAAVGAAAGYSRESPRYHFTSREGLVDALVEALLAEFDLWNMGGAEARGKDRLVQAAQEFRGRIDQQPDAFRAYLGVLAEGLVDPRLQAKVAAANARDLEFLQTHIQLGMDSGGLRSTNGPRAYAVNLLAVLRGAPELWLAGNSGVSLPDIGGEFGNLL